MKIDELSTNRLLLRQWREQDLLFFAALNVDPEIMKFFPAPLNREESNALAEKCKSIISAKGWGPWAVEIKSSGEFIGFVGLNVPSPNLPFSPCVEIAWRLHKNFWGKGYAAEAASKCLSYAFDIFKLNEIVSFTTVSNSRSRSVMERLGFSNTHQNFEHPDLPKDHALSEHVLYKISKENWKEKNL